MFRMSPKPVVFWTTLWTLVRQEDPGKDMERPFVIRRPSADFFYAHEKKSAGDFIENVSCEPKTGCLLDNIVDACSTTRPQKTSGKAFCYLRDRCGFFLCTRKKSAGDLIENVAYGPETGCLLDNIVDACSARGPRKRHGKTFCYPQAKCGFFYAHEKKVLVTSSEMLRMRPRPVAFCTTLWTLVRQQDPRKRLERLFVSRATDADHFFYAHEKKSAGDFIENVSYEAKTDCLLRPRKRH